MKRFFEIIAVAFAIALASAISANAQFAYDFTPEGIESINTQHKKVEASESRRHSWQEADGTIGSVKLDCFWVGPTGGVTFLDGMVRPVAGIALGFNQFALGQKYDSTTDAYKGRRPISVELGELITQREYLPSAITAGERYYSYQTYGFLKLKLLEDRWVRHRLNLLIGGGYIYGRDNYQDVSDPVIDPETGNTIVITDDVYHEGNGAFGSAGLEYRFRLWKRTASALCIRGTADYRPIVMHNVTKYQVLWSASALIELPINSRVK